jgi:Domain of unknown function (DUF4157)
MRTFAQKQNQPHKPVSSSLARPNWATNGPDHREHPLVHLQRTIGNQAVLRRLQTNAQELRPGLTGTASPRFEHDVSRIPVHAQAPITMQPKLAVSTPGDIYEQEADHVSEQVMRTPEPRLQRACACGGVCQRCQTEQSSQDHQRFQTKHVGSGDRRHAEAPPIVHEVLRAPGQPLDTATRAFMEPRFGHDFSRVRIHADPGASHAADATQAQAFTFGGDIVFGSGKFAPSTPAGQKLLAHELTHVVQQGAATAATRSPAGEGATEAGDLRTPRVSEPGRLQRKPRDGQDSPKTEACPPLEKGEREEAAKVQLSLVERIPQQEWLISGFPIGGSEISGDEAGRFISSITRRMQSQYVYTIGQDPLEVLGFSDCVAGPRVDNQAIRTLRAGKFCAGVKDYYADAPKTYPALIHSCGPAPMDQYVGSNASRADRAQNRSILIRRLPAERVRFQEGKESFPYDPKYGPGAANCAAYKSDIPRDILGRVYLNNAHCSCMVTPDEPHNNCVRACLQDKMWSLLFNASRPRKPGEPSPDLDSACVAIWTHHVDCYRDCGCAHQFIELLGFYGVCKNALPCALDSALINLANRCMPATKNDKYLPVD